MNVFDKCIHQINQKYDEDILPPNIRPQFVETLIKNNKCICNRSINDKEAQMH